MEEIKGQEVDMGEILEQEHAKEVHEKALKGETIVTIIKEA